MVQKRIDREVQGTSLTVTYAYILTSEKEASSDVLEVHDDDPDDFELLLKFMYTHEWDVQILDDKTYNSSSALPSRFLNPITVHALADKYDIPALRKCAVQQFPSNEICGKKHGGLSMAEAELMAEAHYSRCVETNSALGLLICRYLVGTGMVKGLRFEDLAEKYPHLVGDLFWAARENGGKLW